jgi:two-component system NtrC family sensor kinase
VPSVSEVHRDLPTTAAELTHHPVPDFRLRFVATYWLPLLAIGIALPIAVYAFACSLDWFAAPFPGFLMMENAVIPTVSAAAWPEDKSMLFHSQVVAVDGTAVTGSAAVYSHAAHQSPETPIAYRFRKGAETFERTLPARTFTFTDYLQIYGILLFFGSICLVSAIVVGFMQPRLYPARIYLVQALLTGLYACTGVFLHRPGFPVLGRLCLVLEAFFAATWIHLALAFPIAHRLRGVQRLWLGVPYVLSAVLAWLVLRGFAAQPPDVTPLRYTYMYNSVALVCFIGALLLGYRETRDPLPRLRVKAILIGALVCLPWPMVAFVDNALRAQHIPVQFALLLTPIGYASLGYAIVKHDLFDINRIVRQTFIYALLSLIVIAAYALLLEVPARVLPEVGGAGQTFLSMAFVVALALGLEPLRRVVQNVVDRAFYRRRLDYRATIRELSAVMITLLDLQEVVAQVTRVVTDAMQLESTTLCLIEDGTTGHMWRRNAVGTLLRQPADGTAVESLARAAGQSPGAFDVARLLARVDDPGTWAAVHRLLGEVDAQAVLPLMFRGTVTGLLALGPKRSGQPLDSEAIDLLRTLADQTAIAVQNARSHQALEALNRDLDAQVRQRTAELRQAYDELKNAQAQLVHAEKMASLGQLVAGVAHELNNPASFAYGGLENIEESFTKLRSVLSAYEQLPIDDAAVRARIDAVRRTAELDDVLRDTPELLRISAEGLDRIKKIVDDLRVFARADSGERLPTDVVAGIDSSLRLLGSQLARAGITANRCYADIPRIAANAGQLNQVWMNLLTNAIDALAGRPSPEVEVTVCVGMMEGADGAEDERCIEVRVRDNGSGIPAARLPRLFEPFFTTKPIGRGTGLGLSIAYGAVKAHGGTIGVESEVGVGTTVTVRLPVSRMGCGA